MALELGERQQATAATALTIVAGVIIGGALLGIGWLLVAFLARFSNVFLPLALGAVCALVVKPYFDFLRTKARLPAPLALVGVILTVLIPLAAFGFFFGAIAFGQLSDMVTRFPDWWERTAEQTKQRWPEVREFFESNPWGMRLRAMVEQHQETLVEGLQVAGSRALAAGAGVARGAAGLLSWAVFPVYFIFFLMADTEKSKKLDTFLPFLKPETRKDVVYLVHQFIDIIVSFFRGQLLIALLQGVLYAIGFSLVGLRYGFVLGLMLGLMNIIPYLGSIIGLGIGLPLAYFQDGGGPLLAGLVLLVFTVVQLIESYLLTPRIMGDRTGLHPVAIIVAIFFWGSALNGIMGMILAIPLTAFLVVFWRLAREKYIGEVL
jgi:predicted PurR-regulated permease PerM